jgi:hypothetical protein
VKRVAVVLLGLLVWCLLPANPAAAEAGVDDEHDLLTLVNRDRAANRLPGLVMDGRLQADARAWSAHLLYVAFEHDPNLPRYDCTLRSENVAYGHRGVGQVHDAFMASAGHRANILRSGVNVAGFGVSYNGSGHMYTVERFYTCPGAAPAQATWGAIKSKWLTLGAAPTWGRPQGTPAAICGGGEYQVFGGGNEAGIQSSAIYWHPNVDGGRAHVTFGPVWDTWGALGHQCGPLGYPTTDPFPITYCRAPANPVAQAFQGGVIEWSAATGAHVLLPGNILSKFVATKGHCGPAGLPTSGVFDWPGAETQWRAQTFEFGYIAEYKPNGQAFFCTWKGACS